MKLISVSGRIERLLTVFGERMSPNAMVELSTITKVALGDTAGEPSSLIDATSAALKCWMIHFADCATLRL